MKVVTILYLTRKWFSKGVLLSRGFTHSENCNFDHPMAFVCSCKLLRNTFYFGSNKFGCLYSYYITKKNFLGDFKA